MSDTIELSVQAVDWILINDEPVVFVCGRAENGESVTVRVSGYRPYFKATQDSIRGSPEDDARVVGVDSTEGTGEPMHDLHGNRVSRIFTKRPGQVSNVRESYEHREADVPFSNRFKIDAGIRSGVRVHGRWIDESMFGVELNESHPVESVQRRFEPIDMTVQSRVCVMDIEVDDRHGFPKDGKTQMPCLGAYDSREEDYVMWLYQSSEVHDAKLSHDAVTDGRIDDGEVELRKFGTEGGMLHDVIEYVNERDFDVMTGWNFTDFDMPYLIDRMEIVDDQTGFDVDPNRLSRVNEVWSGYRAPNVKGRIVFDLLDAYENTQRRALDSFKLDDVADEVLGVGKTEYDGDLGDLWIESPAELLRYNLRDVEATAGINETEALVPFWKDASDFAGCSLSEAPYAGDICDVYVLHQARDKFALPSRGQHSGSDVEGATVMEPMKGVEEWIATLDLASLYPYSMVTINASPETKVDPDSYDGPASRVVGTGSGTVGFKLDEDGLYRELVFDLIDERDGLKAQRDRYDPDEPEYGLYDRQQASVKVITNALYGVSMWSNFRLFDPEVGAAVTSVGRSILGQTKAVADSLDVEVKYGDTDSVLVDTKPAMDDEPTQEKAMEVAFELEDKINAAYDDFVPDQFDVDEHYFDIEFEKLYSRYFQAGVKKRYAGRVVWNEGKEVDDLTITGFEYVRSDTALITRRVQKRVIEMIVDAEDGDDILSYLHDERERVVSGEVDLDEIIVPGGIGQGLLEYSRMTQQVRAALYSNLLLGKNYGEGSKPKLVALDGIRWGEYEDWVTTDDLDVDANTGVLTTKPEPGYICVDEASELPHCFDVDYETHAQKTLKNPISTLLSSIGLNWAAVKSYGEEMPGLEEFM